MTFDVAAELYGRFMGRFSEPLAVQFEEFAGLTAGQRVVDVGCGPGALTARLVERLGADHVVAVDPSAPFVEALRERLPDVEAHVAAAEQLPLPAGGFDGALAQLVVHFMSDPARGLAEMARVCRPGGVVAASVWSRNEVGVGPLTTFWRAARDVDPATSGEDKRTGTGEGDLARLFEQVGLARVETVTMQVSSTFATFEEWWEPYTYGIGPAGEHVARLDVAHRAALEQRCRELLPDQPFDITGDAWATRGRV